MKELDFQDVDLLKSLYQEAHYMADLSYGRSAPVFLSLLVIWPPSCSLKLISWFIQPTTSMIDQTDWVPFPNWQARP